MQSTAGSALLVPRDDRHQHVHRGAGPGERQDDDLVLNRPLVELDLSHVVLRLALFHCDTIRLLGEGEFFLSVDLVQILAGEVDAKEIDLSRAVETEEVSAPTGFRRANVDQAHITDGEPELERIEIRAQGPVAHAALPIPEDDHPLQDRMLDPRQQAFNRPRHSQPPHFTRRHAVRATANTRRVHPISGRFWSYEGKSQILLVAVFEAGRKTGAVHRCRRIQACLPKAANLYTTLRSPVPNA